MDKNFRGLLVGCVYGDGYLRVSRRLRDGKYPYTTQELKIAHSINQLDYCQYKFDLIKEYVSTRSTMRFYDQKLGEKTFKTCQFSVSHKYFKTLHGMMYPDGVKTIKRQCLDMLTPQGIAIWYMDDGTPYKNTNKDGWITSVSTVLATMCSRREVDVFIEYFLDRYGIEFRPAYMKGRPESTGWYVRANTKASRDFVKLIYKYIPPSMMYKINHVADLKTHECVGT